ncbi:MAG: hypothetical protein IAE77_21185 [Prosthecobacter sp.]|uniref:hypothetical protein n=1 Tax=Prosthecobacter sp. TaxID=1965333 RepID=UPI0019DA8FCE|nr:hypothetical protein [Prosthecobacter sp.]MBE2285984.1 hypothetical protein [Prosthecobacter sp.]
MTASLICPACGQAFLSMQHAMEGVAQCPHCAHSGPRSQFGTHGQTAGLMPVRRRVAQSQQAADFPVPGQAVPPPMAMQPAQPTVWPGVPQVAAAMPPPSVARATLQPSQALMPVGEPPPPGDFTIPQPSGGSGWRHAFIMLAFCVVCGAAVWVWWDHANAPGAVLARQTTAAVPQPSVVEIRAAPPLPKAADAAPKFPPPDMDAIAADAKALVTELFAADTPERRAACIHDAAKHAAEIEATLGPAAQAKIELRMLARIPGIPLTLPGGEPAPLFKLATSRCPNGALVRLVMGVDGKRRIHWPLLIETHHGMLGAFLKQGGDVAAWFHVAMRPSHGLDIPADMRAKYLTFDAQTSATSDPHFVACVERDTPLGRFLDRESEWGKVYVSRLLVRHLDIKSEASCMLVVDCEGAPER